MSNFSITDISINVKATATDAGKAVDALQSKVQQLGKALSGLQGTVKALQSVTNAVAKIDAQTAKMAKNAAAIQSAQAKASAAVTEANNRIIASNDKLQASQVRNSAAVQEANNRIALSNERVQQSMMQLQERTRALQDRTVANTKRYAQQEEVMNSRIAAARERAAQAEMRTTQIREKLSTTRLKQGFDSDADATDNLSNKLDGLRGTLGRVKAALVLVIATKLADWLSSAIDLSNQYVENLNLFNVQMGQFTEDAIAFSEKLNAKLGVDPSATMRYMGFFMQLADGMGVAADKSYLMSKNLTLLTYDLSSFLNLDFETAYQKLSSGIAGELEPLRRVGYSLSEASLQANLNAAQTREQLEAVNALTQGLEENSLQAILNEEAVGANVRQLTEAQKVELRYVSIIQNATKAMGDMGRTLNSPANQLRVLRVQFDMLARSIGNIFIPILNKVIPYLIALAQILREVANAIAAFMHFELPEVDYSTLVDDSAGVASNFDDAAAAAKKAKDELKDAMLPFDELHVLDKPKEDTGGGAADTGIGTGGELFDQLPDYTDILDQFADMNVQDIKSQLYDLLDVIAAVAAALGALKLGGALFDGLKAFKKHLQEIHDKSKIKVSADASPLEKVKSLATDFVTGIAHGMGMLVGISGEAAAAIAPFAAVIGLLVYQFLDLYQNSEQFRTGLERVKEILDTLGEALGIIGDAFYETFIKPIGEFLGMILPPEFIDWFIDLKLALDDLDWVTGDFVLTFGSLALVIGGFLTRNPFAVIAGGIGLIGEAVSIAVRAIGGMDAEEFEEFKQGIITKAHEMAEDVPGTILNMIRTTLDILTGGLSEHLFAIVDHWDEIKETFNNGFDAIFGSGGVFDRMAEKLAEIPDWFAELPEKVGAKMEEFKAAVSQKLEEVYQAIMSSPLGTVLSILFASWEVSFSTVEAGVEVFKSVISGDFSAIPGIISGHLDSIPDTISGIPEKVNTTFIKPFVEFFKGLPEEVMGAIGDLGAKIDEMLGGWPSKFLGLFDGAKEETQSFYDTVNTNMSNVNSAVETMTEETEANTDKWGTNVSNRASSTMQSFYDSVNTQATNSRIKFSDTLTEMTTNNTDAFNAINSETSTQLNDWYNTTDRRTDATKQTWKQRWEDIQTNTTNTWSNMNRTNTTNWATMSNTNTTNLDSWVRTTKEHNDTGERNWADSWNRIKSNFADTWASIVTRWNIDTDLWWEDVADLFSYDTWSGLFDNMLWAFKSTVRNILDRAWDAFYEIQRLAAEAASGGDDGGDDAAYAALTPGSPGGFHIPVPTVKGYASGGIPSSGNLFMANENNMPELVGSFGNSAGVVNNEQIIDAMTNAVYAAMVSAMSEQGQQPLVVELDGQVIYNNQRKIEHSRGLGNFELGSFRR